MTYSLKPRKGHNHDQHPSVAAFDAPDCCKAAADFVCDGADDEIEVQAATDQSGGTVYFSPGTFFLRHSPEFLRKKPR